MTSQLGLAHHFFLFHYLGNLKFLKPVDFLGFLIWIHFLYAFAYSYLIWLIKIKLAIVMLHIINILCYFHLISILNNLCATKPLPTWSPLLWVLSNLTLVISISLAMLLQISVVPCDFNGVTFFHFVEHVLNFFVVYVEFLTTHEFPFCGHFSLVFFQFIWVWMWLHEHY